MANKRWTHLKLKNGDNVSFIPPAPNGAQLGGITQSQREFISQIQPLKLDVEQVKTDVEQVKQDVTQVKDDIADYVLSLDDGGPIGVAHNNIYDFALVATDKRFVRNTVDLPVGTKATIQEDSDYRISISGNGGYAHTGEWGFEAVTTAEKNRFVLKHKNAISLDGTDMAFYKTIVYSVIVLRAESKLNARITALERRPTPVAGAKAKYAHISFDDYIGWVDFIDNAGTYSSIFDNTFLSQLKAMHDEYGTVFSLYCFNDNAQYNKPETATHSIVDVPDKFTDEFSANSDWLKFGFHCETNDNGYASDNVSTISASYSKFVSAIIKMTGTYDCIDRIPRLQSFKGTKNNCIALRDCECGCLGFIVTNESAIGLNYFLENGSAGQYPRKHNHYFDAETQLHFVTNRDRIELQTDPAYLSGLAQQNGLRQCEIYTHYDQFVKYAYIRTATVNYCAWLKNNGYGWAFAQDALRIV